MRHYLTFGGRPTTDFNIWISGGGTYDAPERDITLESVPGRNGDLSFDNGRFNNIEVEYPAFISRGFKNKFMEFTAYAKSLMGYQRLEDTYHQDYYRLAVLSSDFSPETTASNLSGEFTITFNCKPQRFLKSGEKTITQTSTTMILKNPTLYEAKPLIRAYGTGEFKINNVTVQINTADTYTDIDCELMDAYKIVYDVLVNKNACVFIPEYPVLSPGDNTITKSGLTKLEIIPRWWTV